MDTLRILVVDDEPGIRRAVVRDLVEFSVSVPDVGGTIRFTVDEAESAEQALEKFDGAPPHILLLDLKLPGMSGLDLLDIVADKHPDLLTIMITAYASIETAVRATKTGAYDFLAKPFTPDELENAVQKAARHIVIAEQARQLALQQRQVRFQFISVLAHELKAPLNAVEGYLQVVKDRSAGDDPEVYNQMLGRCLTRIQFMRKMILDLLDLTRIESGQKKRELGAVVVREVAQLAVETAAPEAQAKNVTITIDCPDSLSMYADRNELEIVFNNLISNAVKYNKPGGQVAVTVSKTGDRVAIAVKDTGIGLTPEDAARLFESFVRVKSKDTRDILGSGLGLAIVKKIALLYDGDATVTSELGAGSTFTVTLKDAPPAEANSS